MSEESSIEQNADGQLVLNGQILLDSTPLEILLAGQWTRGRVKQKGRRWVVLLDGDRSISGVGRLARRVES